MDVKITLFNEFENLSNAFNSRQGKIIPSEDSYELMKTISHIGQQNEQAIDAASDSANTVVEGNLLVIKKIINTSMQMLLTENLNVKTAGHIGFLFSIAAYLTKVS